MGKTTVTYQQAQQVAVGQAATSGDSLATNKSLRTPIQEISTAAPRHLQVKQAALPKKKIYRTWSSEDSVYFNLKSSDGAIGIGKVSLPSESTVEKQALNKTAAESIQIAIDTSNQSVQNVVSVPPPPVIQRKGSPFEESKDWLAGFILLALIVAGFIKLTAGKYLSDLFSSVRYQQSASKLFFSGNLQNQKPSWALTVLFFLSTSMLIFEFAHLGGKSPQRFSPFIFFILVNAGVVGYFILKNLLYRFVAAVFEAHQATKEYLFNANMLSKVFGIACLPIVSIVPFVDVLTATFLLKAGVVLFIIMYIIQLLRGAKIILRSPLSIFYMFLYFCALEILPLSILIKVMIY
ncbi:DUF4271 domain-containing protein [Carboxylicivirga mesophila]|uniref:DUF4271 domain-containing protein n=1 Tax=Carboxylicivirga mesophila TaxID=1166478 RepID=A0ABS5K439_9BACT|nr:DUF4271 domain-containing protein [Carboxylicivirga mesophila]MBS2209796.1 DUF4271 domain-containing protein [Carboxylicivirga mesophila]